MLAVHLSSPLTLKDNLHSRCAAISDYPSRPSSPADRWLYLLIGPLNLLGWRAPRAASGAPEAHRHTTPASALKQAPHAGNHTHTCADAVRTGHSLSTHTIREHSRAREEEGGSREIAHDSDDGVEQAARSCEPTATRAFGVTAIWMDRTLLCLLSTSPHRSR